MFRKFMLFFKISHKTFFPFENFLCLNATAGTFSFEINNTGYGIVLWFICHYRNQYLFQKNKSWTIVKIGDYKIFNSLILSGHTWNIVKNCPSGVFTACRSDLEMFHVWQVRINLLKLQWQSMEISNFNLHVLQWFIILLE